MILGKIFPSKLESDFLISPPNTFEWMGKRLWQRVVVQFLFFLFFLVVVPSLQMVLGVSKERFNFEESFLVESCGVMVQKWNNCARCHLLWVSDNEKGGES